MPNTNVIKEAIFIKIHAGNKGRQIVIDNACINDTTTSGFQATNVERYHENIPSLNIFTM